MKSISRRKFMTTGLAATAGLAGLAAADHVAHRYGLIPPDHGGIYGPGETLTYAAQRLLTRHSLAREFPRSMISKSPFANETAPPNDAFKRLQAGGFSDWRLSVDGMVARPASLSLPDLRSLPVRSQITEVACEEGWSYIAEWIGTPLIEVTQETYIFSIMKLFTVKFPKYELSILSLYLSPKERQLLYYCHNPLRKRRHYHVHHIFIWRNSSRSLSKADGQVANDLEK